MLIFVETRAGMLIVRNSRCRAVTKRMELSGTLVLEDDIQGMDDTRNITQYCQENVDEEVGIATALEKNTKRREEDGEDDLADVACSEWHGDKSAVLVLLDL